MEHSLFKLALNHHQTGNLIQAEKIYKILLQHYPNHPEVLHLLGLLYGQTHLNKKALQYLKKAIEIEPNSPTLYNSLGNVYKHLKHFDKSFNAYQKSLELHSKNPSVLNNLGTLAQVQNDEDTALHYYHAAVRIKNNYPDAHYNLGLIYFKKNQKEKAHTHFSTALHFNPSHPYAHRELGKLAQETKEKDKAFYHYQSQLKQYPQDPETLNNLAALLIEKKEYTQALDHLKRAVELTPHASEIQHNLGAALIQCQKFEEALMCYLNILESEPSVIAYYNLGTLYMYKNHYQDALSYFTQALKVTPDLVDAYINMAVIYLEIGQIKTAISYYKAALAYQPDDQEITYLLDALEGKKEYQQAPEPYLQHLFDQYAPYFDNHLQHYLFYQAPTKLYQVAKEYLNVDKKFNILDLGCGTGMAGALFRPLAKSLIGVDLSEKMLERAREKNIYDQLHLQDFFEYLKTTKDFDIILACDVLPYIGNLDPLFSAVKHALLPQGLFLFTVEALRSSEQNHQLQISARYAHHKRYIENLLITHGFSKERVENIILRQEKQKPLEGYLFLLKKLS